MRMRKYALKKGTKQMINNEILKNIADRRSVRRYKDMPVEDDKLMTILEAGRQAPSGHNRQPW